MRVINVTQVVTAHGTTPEEFDADLNRKVRELAERGISADVQLNTTAGLVAHIFYQERTQKPETVRDEYALQGESYQCWQCPYYEPPTDGRCRKAYCRYAEPYTRPENECCELFYKRLAKGEIEPREVEIWT